MEAVKPEVGKSYRIRHENFGEFFGRCTVRDAEFVGFEIIEGNVELRERGYALGETVYTKTQFLTLGRE